MTNEKYCARCQGAGQVDTGIMESPVMICNDCNGTGLAQQRTWVGLTEQEAAECWSTSTVRTWQSIEAKLKEKNNA